MSKHYIRLDANGYIIKGFSDDFELPLETDICINQHGGRHFELFDVFNPPLLANNNTHLYRYEGGEVKATTQAEQDTEFASFPVPAPQITMEERLTIAEDTLNFLLGL